MLTSLAYYYYSHRQSDDHKIMSFDNRLHSLSTGRQVRGRVIVPVRSVALLYMPYKKTLSLRIFLRQDAHSVCVFFLRQADYLHTYHGTPIEKIMTQKDQWYILRRATIFGFGMKPAVVYLD